MTIWGTCDRFYNLETFTIFKGFSQKQSIQKLSHAARRNSYHVYNKELTTAEPLIRLQRLRDMKSCKLRAISNEHRPDFAGQSINEICWERNN